ncbi:MAG: DUF3368 domain-containing protein [Chroococcales cyanobacterium]
MIIISSTSPISNLAAIRQLSLLPQLYNKLIIPTPVANEIARVGTTYTQAVSVSTLDWISIQSGESQFIVDRLSIYLSQGEATAIALAVELKADLVLLDDQLARKMAAEYGLKSVGLLGILLEAKSQDKISEIKLILNDLVVQSRYRINPRLYSEVLEIAGE